MVEDLDTALKIIGAVLGLFAIIFPVVSAAWMWKLLQTFATKEALLDKFRSTDDKVEERFTLVKEIIDQKVAQIEKDIDRGNVQILRAIEESRIQTCKDIDGVGARITGIQTIAMNAASQADAARTEGEKIALQLHSIDEHGTQATERLRTQVEALARHLDVFNALVKQGHVRIGNKE